MHIFMLKLLNIFFGFYEENFPNLTASRFLILAANFKFNGALKLKKIQKLNLKPKF